MEEHGRSPHTIRYTQILMNFVVFAINNNIAWKDMFTVDTLEGFRKYSDFKKAPRALVALSGYLFSHGRIDQPLEIPRPQIQIRPLIQLPELYEQYLSFQKQSCQVSHGYLMEIRRILVRFNAYLQNHQIEITALKIEHLDAFMAEFKVAKTTRSLYRCQLRGFLTYLYREKALKRDLAGLLVGPPVYAQSKPPRFLRREEIEKLFSSLKLSTPVHIRAYAMVHLAYSLGLRPDEIRKITLDDISFGKGELALPERKGDTPITLPIPEQTIKAIALYLTKARPKTLSRRLFLTFHYPYRPLSSNKVSYHISTSMKQAGLSATAYWLRHTYAQNLLEMGQSIYEIKEMLGHQNIQHTQSYLYINTELMRKVLFDETL